MSRRPWVVKPSEVEHALTAVQKAGLKVAEVKFGNDGFFTIVIGKPGEANADAEDLKKLI